MTGYSMMGAAGAIGLGAIGGATATSGQQGIQNAARFLPAMGSVTGLRMLLRTTEQTLEKKRKRKMELY